MSLHGFINLLTWIYLLRFALLFTLVLVALPLVALKTSAKSLLAGLFDIEGRGPGMAIVALTIMTAAWSIMLTTWLILTYGGIRFHVHGPEFPLSFKYFTVIFSLFAIPILVGVFLESTRQGKAPFPALFKRMVLGLVVATGLFGLARLAAGYFKRGGLDQWIAGWLALLPDKGSGYVSLEGGPDGSPLLLPYHGLALALLFLTLAFYIIIGQAKYARLGRSTTVPTLAYVLLLLMLLCWGLTGAAFMLDRYRIPALAVVLVIYFLTSLTPRSDHYYHVVESVKGKNLAPADAIRAGGRGRVILVAANGGGIQAAAWTARVLTGLELKCREEFGAGYREFGRSIRLISSVSGGSVGAMYFVDAYTEKGLPDPEALKKVVERAEASSLDEVAWGLVYPDFWRPLFPFIWAQKTDRGKALEVALARNETNLRHGLLAWREGVRQGWRPATAFNATIADTGERLLLSTTDLEPNEYGRRNLYDLYPNHDIAVATAARLSASFPYVSPAARADLGGPKQPHFHVVDGGYYDNYGVATLVEWLDKALGEPNNPVEDVLVIEVRGAQVVAPKTTSTGRGWFYQFFAPLSTMLNVRTAVQLAYADYEVGLIKRVPFPKHVKIDSVVFEYPSEGVPLSWHLTKQQKQNIEAAWQQELAHGDGWKKVLALLSGSATAGPADS